MPKKGENIHKRKDGRWEGRYKNGDGKYISVYGKSYREAKDKLRAGQAAKKDSTAGAEFCSAPAVSFKKVCEEWLSAKEFKIKVSTYSAYYTVVHNHLIPFWSDRDIYKIDFSVEVPQLVQQKANEGLSSKRIQEIIQRLKQVLQFAKKHYGVAPLDVELDIQQYSGKEIAVLTEEEQQKLTDLLLIREDVRKLGVLLSLYMGLRIGEICALQWSDIDFVSGVLTISKTLQRVKNFDQNSPNKTAVVIGTPKSIKSRRSLPIPQFLLKILKEYRGRGNEYILTGSTTAFIEPRQYENILKSYLKTACVRPVNYHALRHTFATRAIEKNVDIKTLSEILGHSSITITLQLYVHPSMKNKQICMEKIAS